MILQTIDTKSGCKNFYVENQFTENLEQFSNKRFLTWKKSPALSEQEVDYAWLMAEGKNLESYELDGFTKLKAFHKSFITAKVDLNDNCFFDLIPENILRKYYNQLNTLCQTIDDNFEKNNLYYHLRDCHELLESISCNIANINLDSFKKHISSKQDINLLNRVSRKNSILYNLFGTKTGRLTTKKNSFPVLTLPKKFRECIEPNNDLLLEFDLNSAEARTFLNLIDFDMKGDIHTYNAKHVFRGIPREEAKVKFFSWLYDLNKTNLFLDQEYDRQYIIEKFYDGESIETPFGRKIECSREKVVNYSLQSITNDVVLEGAAKIKELLKDKTSNVYFLLHDSIVLDFCREDVKIIPEIIDIFKDTKVGSYDLNMRSGNNFGAMKEIKI
mgnify:CR=1 FL=1|tara:strand:+ start:16261 stop:17421 length:1161 start_codon:yes stop_codon:yes gene_type:complete